MLMKVRLKPLKYFATNTIALMQALEKQGMVDCVGLPTPFSQIIVALTLLPLISMNYSR